MRRGYELSENCTPAQVKANTGRNKQMCVIADNGILLKPECLNARINYKSGFANPHYYYQNYAELCSQ
jgi:hypothetical protein